MHAFKIVFSIFVEKLSLTESPRILFRFLSKEGTPIQKSLVEIHPI